MPSTQPDPVRELRPVRDVVEAALSHVGPGLYGVACSGGMDSMTLADAAIAVAGAAHVVVLVVDHGLSEGSGAIAAGVVAWARRWGAAGVVRSVVVPRRASLEAAAREVRYAALDQLADELGLSVILTGHTARDQAETVLLRILRGTGPAGLAGIAVRRDRYLRPLLGLPRDAIAAYAAARALPVWADPMNDDLRFARVRVRHEILPLLRAENPNLEVALVRLAASAVEWLAVIDERAAAFARFPIACTALAVEPAAIRKRALATALERAGLAYETAHLDQLDRLVRAPTRGQVGVDLPGSRVVRTYDQLDVASPAHPYRDGAVPRPLTAPAGPYLLRAWQPGDRMAIARLKGRSRKLSDLFIDAKIPRDLRATARVLIRTTDAAIVWAEHLGHAHEMPEDIAPKPARSDGSF